MIKQIQKETREKLNELDCEEEREDNYERLEILNLLYEKTFQKKQAFLI
jgi:hypothetical protein